MYQVISGGTEFIRVGGKEINSRAYLSRFNFAGGDQEKLCGVLSGGERNRLHLALTLKSEANVLLLDEPTNDLDIVTLNILEDYLQSFKGCLIVVSHDRFFMDKVVDHLLVFKGDAVIQDFPGNYSDFRERTELKEEEEREAENERKKLSESKKNANNTAPEKTVEKKKLSFKEKKEYELLEIEIEQLETEKADIEALLSGGASDSNQIIELSKRHSEIVDLIDEKSMRWLELSEWV